MRFTKSSKIRNVIVHADDFGIGEEQSRRILSCAREAAGNAAKVAAAGAVAGVSAGAGFVAGAASEGARVAADAAASGAHALAGSVANAAADGARAVAGSVGGSLNSLSVLVTSPRFRECAALLKPLGDELSVGLHVNLVEGSCAADARRIPLLVNDAGTFKRGFGGLLLVSIARPRASREQITEEIRAQIALFLDEFPELKERLRVDSHQHFHLIPAVFDALVRAIEESGCTVEYIRIPAEPLVPFLRSRSVHLVPAINWVKHGLLNALWQVNKRKVPGLKEHTAVFCGIGFSGRMTKENVGRVAPAFKRYAAAKGMPVEFLFHPGGVGSADECLNPELAGFVDFYVSPNRAAEAEAVKTLAL